MGKGLSAFEVVFLLRTMARDGRKVGITKVRQVAAMHQSRSGNRQVDHTRPLTDTVQIGCQLATPAASLSKAS